MCARAHLLSVRLSIIILTPRQDFLRTHQPASHRRTRPINFLLHLPFSLTNCPSINNTPGTLFASVGDTPPHRVTQLTIPNWLPFLTTQSRMALEPMCARTTRSTLLTPSAAAAVALCSANTHASGLMVVAVGYSSCAKIFHRLN